jgi:hypothetical protein
MHQQHIISSKEFMKYLLCENVEYRLVLIAAGTARKKGIALEVMKQFRK